MRESYEYGHAVRVLRNIRNDGTFPGQPRGALLVRRGSIGFVRDRGAFLQDQVIYAVHFLEGDRIVGCRETELQDADAPWIPSRFECGDQVVPSVPLGISGRVLVPAGQVGEVLRVLREHPSGVCYHVHFAGHRPLQVPEDALEPLVPDTIADSAARETRSTGVGEP